MSFVNPFESERYPIGWVYSQNYLTSSILAFIDITRHSTGLTLVYDYLSLVDLGTSRCHHISHSHIVADYLSFPLCRLRVYTALRPSVT